MQAEIKNYRAVSVADLDISTICLVAGLNESGKTSISQAVAAALTGNPLPISGVKKTEAGSLVRSGTANGAITLTGKTGNCNIIWPSAKVKTEGQAPYASAFAAGLSSIITMDDKERVKTLTEYLKAVPTRADLEAQLVSMGLPQATLDQLWQLIETQGWDNAHIQIKEKGARLKGQWENVTGDRYGAKKSEGWLPSGYDADLMGQSQDTLTALVTDARDALEATIATEAVDDSRVAALQAVAGLKQERQEALDGATALSIDPAMSSQVKTLQGLIDDMTAKRDELATAIREMPQPDHTFTLPCPACSVALVLEQGKRLAVAEIMSDEEKQARTDAIAVEQEKLVAVNAAIQEHIRSKDETEGRVRAFEADKGRQVTEAMRLLGESVAAEKELAAMKPATQGTEQAVIEQCRTTLKVAETRLEAFKKKHDADRIYASIQANQELIEKIAPEGVRGDVLAKALKGFNDRAKPYCTVSGWAPVALESDFSITYRGTPYHLLSESAKFRARVLLQLIMAGIDGSQAVIIDAADILDKGGRNGLFKMLHSAKLPALVTMTMDKRELVPDLKGFGKSYWLEGGVAEGV